MKQSTMYALPRYTLLTTVIYTALPANLEETIFLI